MMLIRILVCVAILAAVHAAPVDEQEMDNMIKFTMEKMDLRGGGLRVEGGGIRVELAQKKEEPLPELPEEEKVDAGLRGGGIRAELEQEMKPELLEKEEVAVVRGGGIRAEQEREKEEPELEPSRIEPQPELRSELASEPQEVPKDLPQSTFKKEVQAAKIAMFAEEELPPQRRPQRRRDTYVVTSSMPVRKVVIVGTGSAEFV